MGGVRVGGGSRGLEVGRRAKCGFRKLSAPLREGRREMRGGRGVRGWDGRAIPPFPPLLHQPVTDTQYFLIRCHENCR